MTITRTIPDIRSINVDKTVRFYTELLGFDVRRDGDRVTAFVSPVHPDVEVTLNRDDFALPPGFTVEVDSVDDASALFERVSSSGSRIVEELRPDGTQFSVLDASGRRVTVALGATDRPRASHQRGERGPGITRAIPGLFTNDLEPVRKFYVDVLGFELDWERGGVMMLCSPENPSARVMVNTAPTVSPDGFDLNVGDLERVERIYQQAKGNWIVFEEPQDFPEHGIGGFLMLDPNGISINVYALLHE